MCVFSSQETVFSLGFRKVIRYLVDKLRNPSTKANQIREGTIDILLTMINTFSSQITKMPFDKEDCQSFCKLFCEIPRCENGYHLGCRRIKDILKNQYFP